MKVAFPSFKVSKFSGEGFSQIPYTLAALALASDPSPFPHPAIQNTLRSPCTEGFCNVAKR